METRQLLALVWEKSKLNLKSEAAINYLSYSWWVIEPVLHMVAYYLIFEVLLSRGGPDFVFFLLTGLVPWLWFSKTVTQGANSLITGRGLMNQLFIPKLFFPLVVITQAGVKQIMVFTLLLAFLSLSGFFPSIHWIALFPILAIQFIFMSSLACLLGVAVAYVRDLSFIIPTALQFLFFASGIFFNLQQIAPEHISLLFINPIAGLIHQYREVLLNHNWPNEAYLLKILVASALLWLVTLWVYKKLEHSIARVTLE